MSKVVYCITKAL